MTKSNKFLLTGAALAGLLAGSASASNLVTNGLASPGAQTSDDTSKQAKEKHACKGQNSCKGKGFLEMSKAECKDATDKMKSDAAK